MIMPKQYTQEQIWKLFEKIPKELKEAISSPDTADSVWIVCESNDLDIDISGLARIVRDVMLGILPPDEFQITIEKELRLKKDVAKKVAQEINRFIFYPVKTSLEELYKIEIAPPVKPIGITPSPEEKPPAPSEKDTYRETVE